MPNPEPCAVKSRPQNLIPKPQTVRQAWFIAPSVILGRAIETGQGAAMMMARPNTGEHGMGFKALRVHGYGKRVPWFRDQVRTRTFSPLIFPCFDGIESRPLLQELFLTLCSRKRPVRAKT